MSAKKKNYPDKNFTDAIKNKNWDLVKKLMVDNPDLNIKDILINSVKANDLKLIMLLWDCQQKITDLNTVFNQSCIEGNENIFLYSMNQYKKRKLNKFNLSKALLYAVYPGNLTIIKQLIESGANIHYYNQIAFEKACGCGHLNIIKYLIEKGVNIQHENSSALKFACEEGQLEVVKYLINEQVDEKTHTQCFIKACLHNRIEVMNYYIFERKLKLTDTLKKELDFRFVSSETEFIIKLFEKRELSYKLEDNLSINISSIQKVKI